MLSFCFSVSRLPVSFVFAQLLRLPGDCLFFKLAVYSGWRDVWDPTRAREWEEDRREETVGLWPAGWVCFV